MTAKTWLSQRSCREKSKKKSRVRKVKKRHTLANGSRTWHCLGPSHVRSHFCRRFGACAFSLLTLLTNLHYYSFFFFWNFIIIVFFLDGILNLLWENLYVQRWVRMNLLLSFLWKKIKNEPETISALVPAVLVSSSTSWRRFCSSLISWSIEQADPQTSQSHYVIDHCVPSVWKEIVVCNTSLKSM